MSDPKVLEVKKRVNLAADPDLMDPEAPRSARVEVVLKGGSTLSQFTPHAFGTKQNPMPTEVVNEKARDLLEPVLGAQRTEAVIQQVNDLENVSNIKDLMPFLTLTPEEMAGISFTH
jgi:2-methylcitrate dehydratase PrpD